MSDIPKAVFDCNTFLQALAAPEGPAGRCMDLVVAGRVQLFVSPAVLGELETVAARPRVAAKLRLSSRRTEEFLRTLQSVSSLLTEYPEVFQYQRDPDDAHYVNLAIASGAFLIVSRDHDLLDLMDDTNADGALLRAWHPAFRVLTPPQFLLTIPTNPSAS